jgi:glutamyl-tRNA synthetase
LHLGNLRTALVAWLSARSQSGRFIVRFEDLDLVTANRDHEATQLSDLAALGLDWDGPVVRQSERFDLYDEMVDRLAELGRVYPCYCTRREIREAIAAPHGDLPDGAYPGTCRQLGESARRAHRDAGRSSAMRLLSSGERYAWTEHLAGNCEGGVDDVVLRRNDGVPAYNLAVVVDDAAQGVTEVVRGDDLLSSTPRQRLLIDLLGLSPPTHLHVPLALAPDGARLAKRHGAVTLEDLALRGLGAADVRGLLAVSLGLAAVGERASMDELVDRFDVDKLSCHPWIVDPDLIG